MAKIEGIPGFGNPLGVVRRGSWPLSLFRFRYRRFLVVFRAALAEQVGFRKALEIHPAGLRVGLLRGCLDHGAFAHMTDYDGLPGGQLFQRQVAV